MASVTVTDEVKRQVKAAASLLGMKESELMQQFVAGELDIKRGENIIQWATRKAAAENASERKAQARATRKKRGTEIETRWEDEHE